MEARAVLGRVRDGLIGSGDRSGYKEVCHRPHWASPVNYVPGPALRKHLITLHDHKSSSTEHRIGSLFDWTERLAESKTGGRQIVLICPRL